MKSLSLISWFTWKKPELTYQGQHLKRARKLAKYKYNRFSNFFSLCYYCLYWRCVLMKHSFSISTLCFVLILICEVKSNKWRHNGENTPISSMLILLHRSLVKWSMFTKFGESSNFIMYFTFFSFLPGILFWWFMLFWYLYQQITSELPNYLLIPFHIL